MLVSVLLPVLNGERFLAAAIDSVLDQTHRDVELLVYDDGSTDGTQAVLARYAADDPRVRAFSAGHRGIVGALNFLYERSRGDVIVLMAHDDVMLPRSIEVRLGLHASTGLPLAAHGCLFTDAELRPLGPAPLVELEWARDWRALLWNNLMAGGVLSMERRIADTLYPIPGDLPFEDWWLTIVALSHARRIAYSPELLFLYRQHGTNHSAGSNRSGVETVRQYDWRRTDKTYRVLEREIQRLGLSPRERLEFGLVLRRTRYHYYIVHHEGLRVPVRLARGLRDRALRYLERP